MRRTASLVCCTLAVAVAGCQPAAAPPASDNAMSSEENAAAPQRQAFNLSEDEAVALVGTLGPPWSALDNRQRNADSLTGGAILMIYSPSGSARVGTLPDGHVWNLQIMAGMAERCGRPESVDAAIPTLLTKLVPGRSVSSEQLALLSRGLRSNSIEQVEIGQLHLTAAGGCVPKFDARYVVEDQ